MGETWGERQKKFDGIFNFFRNELLISLRPTYLRNISSTLLWNCYIGFLRMLSITKEPNLFNITRLTFNGIVICEVVKSIEIYFIYILKQYRELSKMFVHHVYEVILLSFWPLERQITKSGSRLCYLCFLSFSIPYQILRPIQCFFLWFKLIYFIVSFDRFIFLRSSFFFLSISTHSNTWWDISGPFHVHLQRSRGCKNLACWEQRYIKVIY